MTVGTATSRFLGPRMVFLAFLLKNLAVGLTYGSFGALVTTLSSRLDARLSLVSIALPLVVLCGGLLAPLAAWAIRRFSIRKVMITGCLFAATGYVGVAFSVNILQVLLCYGLLIGPGVTLMGMLPCYVLVGNWYTRGQGRAIGIMNMPIMIMIMPLLTTAMLMQLSYATIMLVLAGGYLFALPFAAAVIDHPSLVGQRVKGEDGQQSGLPAHPSVTSGQLLRKVSFLAILLGLVSTMAPAVAINVHLIPLLIERSLSAQHAALLLSVFGGAAALGSFAYGALADRVNPTAALIVNAVTQALAWTAMLAITSLDVLSVSAAAALGTGVGGMMSALTVLITKLYGASNLGRVLGLLNLIGLPILFVAPPLTAAVREAQGSYGPAIMAFVVTLGLAAVSWMVAGRIAHAGPRLIDRATAA